ncbi:response regulator [Massilia yuzhufengensis]|uniref:Response regulator receiver domain-containing protein n=1 Tax=Massilia yuzhufengensis TaxID=1164594 RepID=A0A1I1PYV1_9BURK|nr:response regulator [Massilia yuzhufengensis]SFD15064.1 Response regulator receiver domain-containing protein [Massilia yuzhufengensis]
MRDDGGAVCGLMCTVIEVTDKLRAVARHREAEERLALSLEASGNIGTWSYDLETAATYVDERFARLFQVDAAWPDLFILDIGLPDIDGYALARRLQESAGPRRARYVALTGYGQAHDRVLARTAGFDHHFVEPVNLGALVEVIDRAAAGA